MRIAALILLILAGSRTWLLAGAQTERTAYLPFVARNVAETSWPPTPPVPMPTLKPSPTPAPLPTPTVMPVAVQIVSASSFLRQFGSQPFLFVVGEVENASSTTAIQNLRMLLTLLDHEGRYLDQVSEPAYHPILGPGDTTPFKIVIPVSTRYGDHSLTLDYELATVPPIKQTPLITHTHAVITGEEQYLVGEIINNTAVDLMEVQVVATLYDAAGQVINVVDSGRGANSLYEDVIGQGQKRPFRIALRYGPKAYATLRWQVAYREADRPAPLALPVYAGHAARHSTVIRNEQGTVVGTTQWFELYGEVENITALPVRAVRVYAAFYNEAGQVVNATLAPGFHGRYAALAPGKRSPFLLRLHTGLIPDPETTRFLVATYEPATESALSQTTVTTQRAYRESGVVNGTPVEWFNVIGRVRNDGDQRLRDVRVILTFYDEAGQVVHASAGPLLQPTLDADAASPFRIRVPAEAVSSALYQVDVAARPSSISATTQEIVLEIQAPEPGSKPAIFRGQVHNPLNRDVFKATVYIALYDEAEQILVVEEQLVADLLAAGASEAFSVEIDGPIENWHTYDLGVIWK